MATIYVQFTDSAETAILAVFGAPQDEDAYPNQGTVEANDARYAAFYETVPASMQEAFPSPESAG